MKYYKVVILLLFVLSISCSKEDYLLEQVTDSVRGKYTCVSMIWNGEPIDLDGDGTCQTNLMNEFSTFENAQLALARPVRVYPVDAYDKECPFTLEIPTQAIRYKKATEEYVLLNSLFGDAIYIYFSYAVHNDGSLSYSTLNDQMDSSRYREGDWEIDNVDYLYTQGDCVLSLKDGVLSVRIIGVYYDFLTEKLVTGPVDLVYERVSFSVN